MIRRRPGSKAGNPNWKKGMKSPGKPFPKGVSGNPGGRPKKRPISERYENMVETVLPEDLRAAMKLSKSATYGDAIAFSQARAAIKGNTRAAAEIREAIEGRATSRIELTGANGLPLNAPSFLVVFEDPRESQNDSRDNSDKRRTDNADLPAKV